MKTGNGKIANLPAKIRDELNYRIADGDPGNELVEWLNSNPEVVRVIGERFDGTPISEQNLSEWRKRGYQKWLAHRNMFDESNALGDNAEVIAETGIDCDKLLLTLTAAYAEAIQNWIVTPCEQMTYKLAVYKNLTNGVIALRRAEIQKVRLEIERERLELLREKRLNKSRSSASSTESASRESTASSNPARLDASEPRHPTIPTPPPREEADPPQGFPQPSLPGSADVAKASPTSALIPEPKPSAPHTVNRGSASSTQPTSPVPTVPAQTAAPVIPPRPAAPKEAPLWPTRRPGAPPRNASPRNPLGLL
jgi:hypothetical protein